MKTMDGPKSPKLHNRIDGVASLFLLGCITNKFQSHVHSHWLSLFFFELSLVTTDPYFFSLL